MRKIKLVKVKDRQYLNEVLDSYIVLDNGDILINEDTMRRCNGWNCHIEQDFRNNSYLIYLYKCDE